MIVIFCNIRCFVFFVRYIIHRTYVETASYILFRFYWCPPFFSWPFDDLLFPFRLCGSAWVFYRIRSLYIFFFSGFIVAMNLFSWNIAWKIVLIKIWWHVKFYVRFYPYQWGLDGSTWNIVCRKIEIFPSIQSRTDPFGRTVYIY